MKRTPKAYLVGGSIGSLAAAAFRLKPSRIGTLAGVKRTSCNLRNSRVLPPRSWLHAQNLRSMGNRMVAGLDPERESGEVVVTGLKWLKLGCAKSVSVTKGELVLLQNGSVTDASVLRSRTRAITVYQSLGASRAKRPETSRDKSIKTQFGALLKVLA
jgi:myosin-crossreactive antigen